MMFLNYIYCLLTYPPFILNTMDKQNDFIFTDGKFRNFIFFSKLYMCTFLYPFHKYYLVANYEFSPFVSAKYHLIIVKLKSIWQWMKKSIIIIFSFKILKIFKMKSQTTKKYYTRETIYNFFFLRKKKNSYFLTITNSIHKIYTWFAFCILHLPS